jgi:glucose 1-dehydrogenase
LAPHRINVNAIEPGWIDTPGERRFYTDEEMRESGKRLPWGRMGQPEDIANGAAFLCSDDADYVTGTILRIDGGYMVSMSVPLK